MGVRQATGIGNSGVFGEADARKMCVWCGGGEKGLCMWRRVRDSVVHRAGGVRNSRAYGEAGTK